MRSIVTFDKFHWQVVLELGQTHLIEYMAYTLMERDWFLFPPVQHFATHIFEDCKRFGCAAGYLSAYPFENQLSIFGKVSNL
jgi:hypothetical protein